jgi:Leucine-rich repeat (LRR) protein
MQSEVSVLTNSNLKELYAIHSGIGGLNELGDMPCLQKLDLSRNNISDLTGIERFPKLKILAVRFTMIKSLEPLRGLPLLEELDLTGTKTDLTPLLHIPSLKRLVCSSDMKPYIDKISRDAKFEIHINVFK